MLKFFRKIRQKLLEQGRLRQYLIYALGEILLVVIGILIALQINTWNENRKDREAELMALIDLKEEFIFNKKELSETIEEKRAVEKNWREFLLAMMDKNVPVADKGTLNPGNQGIRTINLTNTILNGILSTGRINNIQNDSLKHLLARWNDIYDDYEEDQTAHWNFVINELRPMEGALIPTNYRGPWENIQFYQQLNSQEDVNAAKVKAYGNLQYQNLLIWNHWWVAQQVTEGNDLEATMNRIIELLEQEIVLKSKR